MIHATEPRALVEQLSNTLAMLHGKLSAQVNGADESCFIIGMRQQVTEAQMQRIEDALTNATEYLKQPQCDVVPQAWTNLLAYVLQDDLHNRLTPRVSDIAYTAFCLAKLPNKEDGGASDWFNDTKPTVTKMIERLRKNLIEELASPAAKDAGLVADGWKLVMVKDLEPLVDSLDRAYIKGYMPDAIADEWEAFDWLTYTPKIGGV